MPGRVHHGRAQLAGTHRVSIGQRLVNRDCLGRRYADPRRLHGQHFQQRIIILVEQDGRAGGLSQLGRAADMINMCVGYDDLFHRKLVPLHDGKHARDVIARINDNRLARALIANDRAVALQRPNGNDLVDHESSLQFTVGSSTWHLVIKC